MPWARAGGHGKRRYTPLQVRLWQAKAVIAARQEMSRQTIFAGPVHMTYRAIYEPPKSWPKWKAPMAITRGIQHTGVPDLDNLIKAMLDAVSGIVMKDDALVVSILAVKVYGPQALVVATFKALDGYASSIAANPLKAAA